MKLLVNVSSLKGQLSGVGRYTAEVLRALLSDTGVESIVGFDELHCYRRESLLDLLRDLDAKKINRRGRRAQIIQENVYRAAKSATRNLPGLFAIKTTVRNVNFQRLRRDSPESVYWEPNFICHDNKGPTVATIYDLSHLRCPQYHPAQRVKRLNLGVRKTLEVADKLTTVSEFSKRELVRLCGVSENNIAVVPPAVSDSFRHTCSPEMLAKIKCKYKLPKSYLLSVGTLEPRKNLRGLINAFLRLPTALRRQFPLVLVGCQGWRHSEMDSVIRKLQIRGEVCRVGFVSQLDLPGVYQGASAFAYLSYYEGFGMPIAEALASGVPVLTSNCASMPEVAKGSALLANPYDPDDVFQQLQRLLLDNGPLCKENVARGIDVTAAYTWKASARSLAKVFSGLQFSCSIPK